VLNDRWSRHNRYLATGSTDSTIIIWDLSVLPFTVNQPRTPLTAKGINPGSSTGRAHTIRLDAPVSDVQFHPRNSKLLLVALSVNEILLVDLRQGGGKVMLEDPGEVVVPAAEVEAEEGAEPQAEVKR